MGQETIHLDINSKESKYFFKHFTRVKKKFG